MLWKIGLFTLVCVLQCLIRLCLCGALLEDLVQSSQIQDNLGQERLKDAFQSEQWAIGRTPFVTHSGLKGSECPNQGEDGEPEGSEVVEEEDPENVKEPPLCMEELTFAVTLDLAHSDNPAIDVQTVVTDDGVKSTYYYQLGKIFFHEVRDGQEEIWDSTDGKKCIMAHTITRAGRMHLSLLVKSGHTTSFVEYEKALDGMWREVEKRLEESRPITLDISHPYHFAFAIDELMEDRMVINRYVPQNGYAIKEVMDGSAILWKAHNDQECILAMVRFDGTGAPILAYLLLQIGDTTMELRLRRKGGKWTQVEKNEYDKILGRMKRNALALAPKDVALDIGSIDENIFKVDYNMSTGATVKTVTPKKGYRVTKIFQSHTSTSQPHSSIWRSLDEREMCTKATLYTGLNGEYLAASLKYKNKDGRNIRGLRLACETGWRVAEQNEFDEVILRIKIGPPEPWTTIQPKPAPPPPPQGPAILDIAIQDLSIYRSFDHYYDDIPIRLIFQQKGVIVEKVVDDGKDLWTPKDRVFYYAKFILRDHIPVLAQIVSELGPIYLEYEYYELKNERWTLIKKDAFEKRKKDLKPKVDKKADFVIHLEDESSTEQCAIFETGFRIIQSRSYAPNPGYHAVEIKFGERSIWHADEYHQRCIKCSLYFKTTPFLLLMIVQTSNGMTNLFFEKIDFTWEPITAEEFNRRVTA